MTFQFFWRFWCLAQAHTICERKNAPSRKRPCPEKCCGATSSGPWCVVAWPWWKKMTLEIWGWYLCLFFGIVARQSTTYLEWYEVWCLFARAWHQRASGRARGPWWQQVGASQWPSTPPSWSEVPTCQEVIKRYQKGTDGTDLLRSQARWARGQAAESGGACTGVTIALGSLAVSQASSTDRAHLRTHAHSI